MSSSRGSMQFQVLKTATQIKLRELNAHEEKLRAHYIALLERAQGEDALRTLYDGTKDLQVVQTKLHPGLHEVGALVDFGQSDPWTTRQSVAQRERQLRHEIRQRRSLWRHNKLLGALLQESLGEETAANERSGRDSDGDDATWEPVSTLDAGERGAAKMTKEETQAQLETYFFAPAAGVDEDTVLEFLETQVFHQRAEYSTVQWTRVRDALSSVRETLREKSDKFFRDVKVTASDVEAALALLLRNSASFTEDVVAFLHDVHRSPTTQEELAHVLTIELGNLRDFAWPAEGIPVQFKRGMNGRFRCHLMEQAVPLILFQYVGMQWSEAVKTSLSSLLRALDDPTDGVPGNSVENKRREMRDVFTLTALDNSDPYDDDGELKTGLETASKEDLLRLLCTEARYASVFSDNGNSGDGDSDGASVPSITAVTTDLEMFGPSVSHAAVTACLKFFGVDEAARAVFKRYMEIPLVFPGWTAPKPMLRGVSVGRAMTMFLSELLLFVMDFSVRSSTGVHLFRRHDDIIFYDREPERVVEAWTLMQRWASVAGLRFNSDKSGSVVLQWSPEPSTKSEMVFGPAPLPQQPIQWGLLQLQSDASVRILQSDVDTFAADLTDRLQHATTVFGWITVYNKYMRFFLRNFGNVSPVFGPAHLTEMTQTLQRLHRRVFPLHEGDVVASLRERIALGHDDVVEDAADLPAAWVQWPLELGGLGLFNPFLAVWSLQFSMRGFLKDYHYRASEPWPKDEALWPWREPFSTAKMNVLEKLAAFEETAKKSGVQAALQTIKRSAREQFAFVTSDDLPDASRKCGSIAWDYADKAVDATWRLRTRGEFLSIVDVMQQSTLRNEFDACLQQVGEVEPQLKSGETKSAARVAAEKQLDDASVGGSSAYRKWLALLNAEQLMDEFGTVAFFSRELLPAQLISTIKKTSVTW